MKTEKILSVVFIIALIFKILHWPGGSMLLILSLMGLCFCYFPLGFVFFKTKGMKSEKVGVSIVFGWLLTVSIIGILFKLMYWPGAAFMLIVGTMTSFFLSIVAYVLLNKSEENFKNYHKNLLIRTVVLGVMSFLLLITPTASIIRVINSDDPILAELFIKQIENPEDESINDEIQAHINKKNNSEN